MVAPRRARKKSTLRVFLGMAGLTVLLFGCDAPAPLSEMKESDRPLAKAWDEAFREEEEIRLELPENRAGLLRISQVLVRSDGKLVIPDGRAKRILLLEPDGRLSKQLQGGEKGELKLSILRTAALSEDDDILVFDPDGGWVTVLEAPEYRQVQRFQIAVTAARLVPLPDGSLGVYSPTSERVFQRFDRKGNRLGVAYPVHNERLRIFHARVQTGGLTRSSNGLVGIHPAAFELVRMSPTLEVKEVLRAPKDSRWQPFPRTMPDNLSPYKQTPAHEAWWDTFDHIGSIHCIGGDHVLVTVFSSNGLREWRERVNIYRLDEGGELVAGGLEVPHGGRIVGTGGGHVYVARDARLGEDESLEPAELYRYRFDVGARSRGDE